MSGLRVIGDGVRDLLVAITQSVVNVLIHHNRGRVGVGEGRNGD